MDFFERPSWQEKAACRGASTSLFFPKRGSMGYIHAIKKYCSNCPVRLECLEIAGKVDYGPGGVFGGLTARQRRLLIPYPGKTCTCGISKCHLH